MVASSLTPSAVATALDLRPDTVDHWISEGWLHPADPRHASERIDLAEALRFIRAHHLTIHRPDALGLAADTRAMRSAQAEAARLRELMSEPEPEALIDRLLRRFAEDIDLPAYLDSTMDQALRPWRAALGRQPRAAAARHLGAVATAIRQVARMIQPTEPEAPSAIAANLDDDQDPTPAALAALVFAAAGCRLESDEPAVGTAGVLRVASDREPEVVCLTLSRPARPHLVAAEEFAALCHQVNALGLSLVTMTPDWLTQPLPGRGVTSLRDLGIAIAD